VCEERRAFFGLEGHFQDFGLPSFFEESALFFFSSFLLLHTLCDFSLE